MIAVSIIYFFLMGIVIVMLVKMTKMTVLDFNHDD